jgi:hypothetical protein
MYKKSNKNPKLKILKELKNYKKKISQKIMKFENRTNIKVR